MPSGPVRKLAEPRRVVVPGGAGALRDGHALATPRFRSCARPPGTWRLLAAAQRPGRATRSNSVCHLKVRHRPRSWDGLLRTGPGNDDGTCAGSGSLRAWPVGHEVGRHPVKALVSLSLFGNDFKARPWRLSVAYNNKQAETKG